VKVELQDASGMPIPGFSFDDSQELFGDEIAGTIDWRNEPDLKALVGQQLSLRIELRDADLFAFRFR